MQNKVHLHDKTFKLFIPNEEIEKAIDAVADRLNQDYADATDQDPVILLCTLNGAVIFAAELLKRIQFPLVLKACKLSSYEGTTSTGVVKTEVPLPAHIEGKRVLIVEDIVDTGTTIVALTDLLKQSKVRDARVCTLLLKKDDATNLYTVQGANKIYSEDSNSAPQYIGRKAVVEDCLINQGATILGKVSHCVISGEVFVDEGAVCENAVLMHGVRVGKGAKVYDALVGPSSHVDPGQVVNAEHDGIALVANASKEDL